MMKSIWKLFCGMVAMAATTACTNDDWGDMHDSQTLDIPFLTFSAESVQTLTIPTCSLSVNIQYSVNDVEWADIEEDTPIAFGGTYGNLRLRGKNPSGTSDGAGKDCHITLGNSTPVACTGDIRTLVDWENYATVNTGNARFCLLFEGCTALTTAPDLPATTLAESCYSGMFNGCTSLTAAPDLPATALTESCYGGMFLGCTSLTAAPELPATALTESCYSAMFYGCTLLTVAPVLPATTLANYCYTSMFYGCTSLATVTMLATDISASYCLERWLNGVAASGTFYKNSAATWNISGSSGIPSGWTVQDYTP